VKAQEQLTAPRCPDKAASAPAKTQATRRRQEASARESNSATRFPASQAVENTGGMVAGGPAEENENRMSNIADIIREQDQSPRPGITFAELREGRCKFPLGAINDPPEWFCGEPAPIGKVYCERCQAIAYNRHYKRR
jgi:hypothetical protein